MTAEEHVLWRELRKRQTGVRFRRQVPVSGFVLDFYAPACRIAVEVDGPVHDRERRRDAARDGVLRQAGVTVLRFPAARVIEELPIVVEEITTMIQVRFQQRDAADSEERRRQENDPVRTRNDFPPRGKI